MTFVSRKNNMGRRKEFEKDKVMEAAFYYFSEDRENAKVENIAVRAGMTRTQLQNHYKIEELRILAVKYALTLIVSDIFKIFSKEADFEVKIRLLILNLMTKTKKHRYLTSFFCLKLNI
jgi:AcrR family transcriptional regulator